MPKLEQQIIEHLLRNRALGKTHHMIINAEGVGHSYGMAKRIEAATGIETRATILGHMQRGGEPCAYDRVLSTRIGAGAAQAIMDEEYGVMIGVINGKIKRVPLAECAGKLKMVSPKDQLVKAPNRSESVLAINEL